ncbi:hypothetical protein V5O48_009790 [Marasmius crinis-equi]|uniref:Uncharacterized protein n=1 Tax=Marasmius crinis-equi TaxID=585013 RepID=A0ABR3FA49_9AGAR
MSIHNGGTILSLLNRSIPQAKIKIVFSFGEEIASGMHQPSFERRKRAPSMSTRNKRRELLRQRESNGDAPALDAQGASTSRKHKESDGPVENPLPKIRFISEANVNNIVQERVKELESEIAKKELAHHKEMAKKEFAWQQQLKSLTEANQKLNQDRSAHGHAKQKTRSSRAANLPKQSLSDHHKSLHDRDKNKWKQKETQMKSHIADLEGENKVINERLRDVQERNASLQKETDKLRKWKGSTDTAKGKQADGDRESMDLLNCLRQSEEVRKELEGRIAELEERCEAVRDASLEEKIMQAKETIEDQEAVIGERDQALTRERETNERLRVNEETLQQRTQELSDYQTRLARLEESHSLLTSQHEASLSQSVVFEQLTAEMGSRDDQIACLQRERDQMLLRERENEGKLKAAEENLREQTRKLTTSEASVALLEPAHKQLLTDQEAVIEERGQALARLRETNEKLRVNEETLQQRTQELSDYQTRLARLEESHSLLTSQYEASRSQSAALEQLTVEMGRRDDQIACLQRERDQMLLREQENDEKLKAAEENLREQIKKLTTSEASLALLEPAHKQLLTNNVALEQRTVAEIVILDEQITKLRRDQEAVIGERDQALTRNKREETLQQRTQELSDYQTRLARREESHSLLTSERDQILLRERENEERLNAAEEDLREQTKKLTASDTSLELLEPAHQQLLNEKITLERRLSAELASLNGQITNLQRDKEMVTGQREQALLRQREQEDKLRTNEETLRQRTKQLQDIQSSLTRLEHAHNNSVSEQIDQRRKLTAEIARREDKITSLQRNHDSAILLVRELEEKIRSCEKESQKLRLLEQARKQDGTRCDNSSELQSQSHSLRTTSEDKDKVLATRVVAGVAQVFAALQLGSSVGHENPATRSPGTTATTGSLSSDLTQVGLSVSQDHKLQDAALPSTRSEASSSGVNDAEGASSSAKSAENPTFKPSIKDFLATNFQKETLRGANIMKENKYAQRSLFKYELVSPISAANQVSSSNKIKNKPWQKKTGRSPYLNQQPRARTPSPPTSSSDEDGSGEGESEEG